MSTYIQFNTFSNTVLLVPAPASSAEVGGQVAVPGLLFAVGEDAWWVQAVGLALAYGRFFAAVRHEAGRKEVCRLVFEASSAPAALPATPCRGTGLRREAMHKR